jgi:hypothetical protein
MPDADGIVMESRENPSAVPDFTDAHWFPVDLHVSDGRYAFLRLDEDVLARSTFLDTRIDAPLTAAIPVPAAEIAANALEYAPAWLFHTSFCGSTLLARALHLPPYQVCLKEPLVLRRLADAQDAGLATAKLTESTLRLLGRPWQPSGRVIVKPTHVALNIAPALLDASPTSKAIILTSSLDDFLISNLKKTSESQAKIPALVERAMRAGNFHKRLPEAAMRPPDLLCAAGLQWAAQRELMQDLVERYEGRMRPMDMRVLLASFEETLLACARWLELQAPQNELLQHARIVFTRNAKSIHVPFDPARREQESALVTRLYGAPLAKARTWLDDHVLAAMRPAAAADPAPWTC